MWRDEAATIVVARRSPLAIVEMLRHDDAPLGAYYLFMHFWIKVSSSAAWLRLPSAVAAAVTVGLLYLLGTRLAGAAVGVVGAIVLAALPFSTRFAQEARPYALAMCGATAATLLLVRALDEPSASAWAWYSAAMTVTVALHLLAATLVAAHLVTCIWTARGELRRYRGWALSVLPPLALAAGIGVFTAGESASHAWIPKAHLSTPYYAAIDLAGSRRTLALLVAPAVIAAGLVAVRRWRFGPGADASRSNVASVAVPWFVLPVLILVGISLSYPVYVSRYVLFALPALALIAAAGVVTVWRVVRLPRAPKALQVVVACCAAAALAVVVHSGQVSLRGVDSHGDNPSAEAAYLVAKTEPGDGILYSPRDLVHSLLPFAPSGRLPADALLKTSATASHTLNGVEVSAASASASMVRFDRLWVLEVPGSADTTALADAEQATLVAHYRVVSTKNLPGTVLVLYQKTGS